VSLLPVQDIRTAMIRVLCDMIYVINKQKDNLLIFENEFVTVMDKFANEPLVEKNFKEYLINAYVLNYSK
jgi:thioredoxin-related protein